jgi:hypothetical protein
MDTYVLAQKPRLQLAFCAGFPLSLYRMAQENSCFGTNPIMASYRKPKTRLRENKRQIIKRH